MGIQAMKKVVVSLLFGGLFALGCGPASTPPPLPYTVPPAAATAGTAPHGYTPPPAKTGP